MDVVVCVILAFRFVIRHQRNAFGRVGQSQLAGRLLNVAGSLPGDGTVLVPEIVHMDIVIFALLVLRQHPEIAQDDDLGLRVIDSDILFPCQIIVHLVINRVFGTLFDTPVRCEKVIRAAAPSCRLPTVRIAVGIVVGHIGIGVCLFLPVRTSEGKIRFLGDIDRAVGLLVIVPAAHRSHRAAAFITVFVIPGVLQVVLMDVAVTQCARGEHIGKCHGGGLGRGNLSVDLCTVTAGQLEDLGHIVRGGDHVFALREGDTVVAFSRFEAHGLCLKRGFQFFSADPLNCEGVNPAAVTGCRLCDSQCTVPHCDEMKGCPRLYGAEGVAGNFHLEAVRLIQVHRLLEEITSPLQPLEPSGLSRFQFHRPDRRSALALAQRISVGDMAHPYIGRCDRRRGDLHPPPFIHGEGVVYIVVVFVIGLFFSCVLGPLQQAESAFIGRCLPHAKS